MTRKRIDDPLWPLRCITCYLMGLCVLVLIAAPCTACAQAKPTATFNDLAQRANAARDKGEIAPAIQLYRSALALKPLWQEGLWSLGSLLYDDNQFGRASIVLHKLTTLNPGLGAAWALLGLCEFETGNDDPALSDLRRARALGIGSSADLASVADYHLAVLLNSHGEFEAANILLNSLFLHGHKSEDIQVAMGMAFLRVPLLPAQLDPSKDALVHDAGSLAAVLAQRQYDEAEAGFKALLQKYPDTPFVHYTWGAMLAMQGKDDAAEAEFERETKLNPGSALAFTEWAYLESKAGRFAEAISLAKTAIGISDSAFMAHYVLGTSLLATGKAAEAVPQLERARDLAPESPEIRYSLSRAYAKLGRDELARREQAEFLLLKNKQQTRHDEKSQKTTSMDPETAKPTADLTPQQ